MRISVLRIAAGAVLLICAASLNAASPAEPSSVVDPAVRTLFAAPPINLRDAERQEALHPSPLPLEWRIIHEPQPRPPTSSGSLPERSTGAFSMVPYAPGPSSLGSSPPVAATFKAQEHLAPVIPPDTMGAVGATHVVTVTNDRVTVQNRNGVIQSTVALNTFWSGVLGAGVAVDAFDPKILFDRFNSRFIFVTMANQVTQSSATLIAVSQTPDPTGTWSRYFIAADPTATVNGGKWADFPSIGFNTNWIVVQANLYNWKLGNGTTGYAGPIIYVLNKTATYAGPPMLPLSTFQPVCTPACFTMSPAITEDDTTATEYLAEVEDETRGLIRISKITGTPDLPALAVGSRRPSAPYTWRDLAPKISPSGGFIPERDESVFQVSDTRLAGNDSRFNTVVFRNGSLWAVHHVMVDATPAVYPTVPNINHVAVQWWQIDPAAAVFDPPIQFGRIDDPNADNCYQQAAEPCISAPLRSQKGAFFAYPALAVNKDNDVLIGYTMFSAFTYPSAAYSFRSHLDPINTMRDPVVFRAGQGKYNFQFGQPPNVNNRWGDYSAAQTDPVNDTDFWTIQEYADFYRDIGFGLSGVWSTWWARVSPATPAPSPAGNVIISEFRLRGPQGPLDEFIELYNPADTDLVVTTTDGSDGWAIAFNDGATTTPFSVIPVGTVIAAHGAYLVTRDTDGSNGDGVVYSLNASPNATPRSSDGDAGYAIDIPDNAGVAVFRTANPTNFGASTVLDAAGFSTLPAGSLFKEGNGIPAISGSPAGQMSFVRDLSSGTPKDTNANESDFLFVDPVIETLGVQPRLGAAGPQNTASPVRTTSASGISSQLFDVNAGAASPPNLVRVTTPGPAATSSAGTMTFRRKFTNDTSSDITRLRFRIVNLTTRPLAASGLADLRAISTPAPAVGTTLEQPPTQAAGGGFNGSLSANSVSAAQPFAAHTTIDLQITAGVQSIGNYNFCLAAETLPPSGSPVLCFSGNTEGIPAPTNVVATYGISPAAHVDVTWNAVTGAVSYQVERSAQNFAFAPIGMPVNTNAYNDGAIAPDVAYLYRVRAIDGGSVSSTPSNVDLATTIVFGDDPAVANATVVKATQLGLARTAIDAVRAAAGLGSFTYTDPSPLQGALIKAVDMQEMRTVLNDALTKIGLSTITFASSANAGVAIRASDLNEIRNGVK